MSSEAEYLSERIVGLILKLRTEQDAEARQKHLSDILRWLNEIMRIHEETKKHS